MRSIVRRAAAVTAVVAAAALTAGCGANSGEPKLQGTPDTRIPSGGEKKGDGVAPPPGGGGGKKVDQPN